MKKLIFVLFLFSTCFSCSSSSDVNILDIIKEVKEIQKELNEEEKLKEKQEEVLPEPSLEAEEPKKEKEEIKKEEVREEEIKKEEVVLVSLPKTDCNNPPKQISSTSGFKCMGSATRGGSTVCLLPWELSRPPFETITDHHNQTFKVSKKQNFDSARLILKNDEKIEMKFAGQHNPVYLAQGKIAREHWRNESIQYDRIKNRLKRIELFYNKQKVCLGF